MGGSGSPLMARTQVNILLVIVIIVAIIAVLAAIYFISRAIQQYHQSPAYLEKQRQRPTSAADISEVAKEANLTREERDLLQRICKLHPSPNITYLSRDFITLESLLHEAFDRLHEKGDENGKAALFTLRTKMKRTFTPPEEMTSSRKIDIGTKFTYTAAQGIHHKLTYVSKTEEALVFQLPPAMVERRDLPPALSRISLIFEHTTGSPYQMETRVVRYQKNGRGEEQMVTMHSEHITPLQKRQGERIEMQQECAFSAVQVLTDTTTKNAPTTYKPSPNMHKGELLDVSVGGCRLVASIPIKAEQFIYIKGKLNTQDEDSAIGTILRTTKRQDDGKFILHIKFVKIEQPVVNRIQAVAIGYA